MKYLHTTFKGQTATETLTPGSDAWARTVSASKIPALLGLSTYDSAYSLWARATGRLENIERDTKATQRGNLMEATLLTYLDTELGDGHRVTAGAAYIHPEHPTWSAAPDGHVYEGRRRTPYALVECKTARYSEEWGTEGTAEIPPGYLAQVAWQMYVTGARLVYVPALVAMEFRLYVVQWEDIAGDIDLILGAVQEWQACVDTDTAPAWDGSDATYEAVRRLHPLIDPDAEATIPCHLADALWAADADLKAADATLKALKSEVLDLAGNARTILTDTGLKVGGRQARGTGTPYLTITKPKATAPAVAA